MWKKIALFITSKPPVARRLLKERGNLTPVDGPGDCKFVALEYYGLIFNRTYLVTIVNGYLCGAVTGGLLASGRKPNNPDWYLNQENLKRCRDSGIGSNSFLELNKNNFRIGRGELTAIEFDDTAKWGMGAVPYSGRLHFKFSDDSSREFILLGYQDGEKLKQNLIECGFGRQTREHHSLV